jgi:hypothetical protein
MSDHIPTFADLCSAIAEGRLSVASDGATYQVSALELRRYFNKHRAVPIISSSQACASSHSETSIWSLSNLCSLGL